MYKVDKDAESLKNAMKGAGTDEDTIINIISTRPNIHLQKIRQYYTASYGKNLLEELESELSGDLKKLAVALVQDPVEYDAMELHLAMKGLGTNEKVLIDIIGTRTNEELEKIKIKFKEKVGRTLEEDIIDETSGDFKNLLVSLLQCKRSQDKHPDLKTCEEKAKKLYQAGEGKIGTDEEVFNKIFALSSKNELKYIAQFYNKQRGKSLLEAIDSEFSGDIKSLLNAIVYGLLSPAEYFAGKVRTAVKGLGTDEKELIRIFTSRRERDIPKIRLYYKKLFDRDMDKDIQDDVGGKFGNLLMKIIESKK